MSNLSKNQQISQTFKETKQRRSKMLCKSVELKIDESKLSNKKENDLGLLFVEAKRFFNFCLADLNSEIPSSDSDLIKAQFIKVRDKDGNFYDYEIQVLSKQARQKILRELKYNLKSLSRLKDNGFEVGELGFKSEVNSISFIQPNVTYKLDIPNNRIKLQGIKGYIKVSGFDQLKAFPEYETADIKLIRNAEGLYLKLTIYVPKITTIKNDETIGLDFGIQKNITTSKGKVYQAYVEESDRLKRLQRKLSRQKKGSNRWLKTKHLIAVEYQKMNNQKRDLTNKIVADLEKISVIVMQDENLQGWHKDKRFSSAVQHSVLGKVKAKLLTKDNVVVLDRYLPTSKLCTNCGKIHDELELKDRQFVCDCGVTEDRDIHAAQTMVWLYKNKIGMGRTKSKRGEIREQIKEAALASKISGSLNREAVESLAQR